MNATLSWRDQTSLGSLKGLQCQWFAFGNWFQNLSDESWVKTFAILQLNLIHCWQFSLKLLFGIVHCYYTKSTMRFRNQDPIFQEWQNTFPPRVTNTRIIKRRVAGIQPFVVRPEGKCEGSEYLKGPVPKHPSLVVMGRWGDVEMGGGGWGGSYSPIGSWLSPLIPVTPASPHSKLAARRAKHFAGKCATLLIRNVINYFHSDLFCLEWWWWWPWVPSSCFLSGCLCVGIERLGDLLL